MRTKNKKRSLLTVIVPIYNEADSLAMWLPTPIQYCREHGWKLILVNDGSSDNTPAILEQFKTHPDVRIFHHKINRGYGGALKTGILHAETTYAVTIDADGQHEVSDIDRLWDLTQEKDADLVVGNRGAFNRDDIFRSAGKWLIRAFTRLLMPLPISDLNSGFKLYRTELVQKYLPLCPDSMAFSDIITLIFINQRNLVLEHPITVRKRKTGKSTINFYTAVDTIIEILNIAMLFNPLRIFLPISLICIGFGLTWGAHIILLGRGVSVGSMLALVTGLLFFFIGLIASQLSAIRLGSLTTHTKTKE